MNRRFLIASGGTGGHFYPGFVIGKNLRRQGCAVLFIVRKNDPAAQILEANHLHYREIDFMGLPRSLNPVRHLQFTLKFFKSLLQTRHIIRQFKPDVALGTGGYISFPLIFTAHLMGLKTAVHDSNARLGLANRICGWFADLFMLGLPINKKLKNSVLTSTPIRREFTQPVDRKAILENLGLDPNCKTALVVGGSQGAKNLNWAVVQIAQQNTAWQFIHITGERWYQTLSQAYNQTAHVAVLPYSHEIYALMKAVDLIICRSGASTLAELIYCHLPAILVPFPHAAANHQYYNAKILKDAGCAELLLDDSHLPARLQETFNQWNTSGNLSGRLDEMHRAYQRLTIPNPISSAKNIARLLCKL
ncbi:MAG: UDP-N-acetylglucosamine--N-acetylmuramyl-(pentapeptide) pyrophosphoryl-undecaprenol N-acetylglucosamine transferase [Elusimicrobiaceae bacterium]|nr:UDP-N-acetylglucosamine--N-acetylmuramyl-(pentapeptide) pyrophosphoryl-undecaprenol N-acetylglucosamine transferase [Elusimicrobiaceae bacterium]